MVRYTEFLKKAPLFRALSEPELDRIAESLTLERCPRGKLIVQQGDPGDAMYLILVGRIKVVLYSEGGREVILATLGPGECFGEMALITERPRSAHVIALEDTSLLRLARKDLVRHVRESPDIALSLLRVLAERLAEADEKIGDLALVDVYGRVARYLIRLAAERGARTPEGTVIENRPSNQEIANVVGTARETVSRAMSDFVRQGRVRIEGKTLVIPGEPAALEDFRPA